MNRVFKKLKLFDLVVILYIILTGIFILFSHHHLQNEIFHLSLRAIFILSIYFLVLFEEEQYKLLNLIRNFYPLLLLGFFYSETDYYNNIFFDNFDPLLVQIEEFIFKTQPSLDFSEKISNSWFSELMHWGYFSYYLFTLGIPLLFYTQNKSAFNKSMFIIISSFCAYYIIFILFPAVGPQFYFEPDKTTVPKAYLFDKIMHFIIRYGETETGAFPSSHVGMTVVFLILIWQNFRKYFTVLLIPACLLMLSTVYIKAHYVIDVLAGLLSGILFYIVSIRAYYTFIKQKE